MEALEAGLPNLLKHVENITQVFKLPAVVAINEFPTDSQEEINLIKEKCNDLGVNVILSQVWAKGGEGGVELAKEVVKLCEEENNFEYAYSLEGSIKDKINQITLSIYFRIILLLHHFHQYQFFQLMAPLVILAFS